MLQHDFNPEQEIRSNPVVSREVVENLLTADQELILEQAIIPYRLTIVDRQLCCNGKPWRELLDPPQHLRVKGYEPLPKDLVDRLFQVEKILCGDLSVTSVIVSSPDSGSGRSYIYVFDRDKNNPQEIKAVAVEHRGTLAELNRCIINLVETREYGILTNNPTSEVFALRNSIPFTGDEIYKAAEASYTSQERREDMILYLSRLRLIADHFETIHQGQEEKVRDKMKLIAELLCNGISLEQIVYGWKDLARFLYIRETGINAEILENKIRVPLENTSELVLLEAALLDEVQSLNNFLFVGLSNSAQVLIAEELRISLGQELPQEYMVQEVLLSKPVESLDREVALETLRATHIDESIDVPSQVGGEEVYSDSIFDVVYVPEEEQEIENLMQEVFGHSIQNLGLVDMLDDVQSLSHNMGVEVNRVEASDNILENKNHLKDDHENDAPNFGAAPQEGGNSPESPHYTPGSFTWRKNPTRKPEFTDYPEGSWGKDPWTPGFSSGQGAGYFSARESARDPKVFKRRNPTNASRVRVKTLNLLTPSRTKAKNVALDKSGTNRRVELTKMKKSSTTQMLGVDTKPISDKTRAPSQGLSSKGRDVVTSTNQANTRILPARIATRVAGEGIAIKLPYKESKLTMAVPNAHTGKTISPSHSTFYRTTLKAEFNPVGSKLTPNKNQQIILEAQRANTTQKPRRNTTRKKHFQHRLKVEILHQLRMLAEQRHISWHSMLQPLRKFVSLPFYIDCLIISLLNELKIPLMRKENIIRALEINEEQIFRLQSQQSEIAGLREKVEGLVSVY